MPLPSVSPRSPTAKPDPLAATFAPADMLRLIGLGLGRPDGTGNSVDSRSAGAAGLTGAATSHGRVLDEILGRQGPFAVLRLGESIVEAPEEPTVPALAAATSARDLIGRWQRLESYVHSKHRIRYHAWGEHQLTVDRYALDASQPIRFAAELLVHGMLAALLERVLATPVEMHLVATGQPLRQRGRWQIQARPILEAGIDFRWTPRPGPSPAPRISVPRIRDAVRGLILADPARHWSLGAVASELELASRTLQRRLRDEGCRFATLVQDARATHASRLLTHSREPIAAIGFVSGYADQSHFTREFKRRTAMTPALFRNAFAVVLNPLSCTFGTPQRSLPAQPI